MKSLNDIHLSVCLGSVTPAIADFPHVLFPPEKHDVEQIVAAIGDPVGVIGQPPLLVDSPGPLEDSWSRLFLRWNHPRNQQHAIDAGSHGDLPGFSMIVPLSLSQDVVEQLYADLEHDGCEFDYEKGMASLATWIDRIGWAYVPLQPESVVGLLVAASANKEMLETVKASVSPTLRSQMFSVVRRDSQYIWDGPWYIDPDAIGVT